MAQAIPLTHDARQTFRSILGGQSVRLTVWWQPLTGGWYVSLRFTDGRPIAAGLRLCAGALPLRGYVTDFAGGLYLDGDGEPDRLAWMDATHRLLWIAPDELP